MDTDAHEWESDLTEVVIGAAFGVAMSLLYGVFPKAQVSFPISYKGKYLGEYAADLVVDEKVIVELKCVDRFANEHPAQCIYYLKASRLTVALLINFQKPKVEWKRVLLDR